MSYRTFPDYIPKIVIFPEGNIADPEHLIAYAVPSMGMCSGGRVVRFLIWLLTKAVKRELRTAYIHTNDWESERRINEQDSTSTG